MKGSGETVAAEADEKPASEKSAVGEKEPAETPLVKIQKPLESGSKDFSPTRKTEFSPTPDRHFSPTPEREFSPTKKPRLALVKPAKNGRRGRPRNPELPPAPDKYFYWSQAGNGLKLEKRKPFYEYVGFIMPNEWAHLRGQYDESYILQTVIAAIRIKRSRSAQSRRHRAGHTR